MTRLKCIPNLFILVNWAGGKKHVTSEHSTPFNWGEWSVSVWEAEISAQRHRHAGCEGQGCHCLAPAEQPGRNRQLRRSAVPYVHCMSYGNSPDGRALLWLSCEQFRHPTNPSSGICLYPFKSAVITIYYLLLLLLLQAVFPFKTTHITAHYQRWWPLCLKPELASISCCIIPEHGNTPSFSLAFTKSCELQFGFCTKPSEDKALHSGLTFTLATDWRCIFKQQRKRKHSSPVWFMDAT